MNEPSYLGCRNVHSFKTISISTIPWSPLCVNSPAQDFNVYNSWSGLLDHICNEVVFIAGAVRSDGPRTLGWRQYDFQTLPVHGNFAVLLFLTVHKRDTAESQTQRQWAEQRPAPVPTPLPVPVRPRVPVQARVPPCSSLVAYCGRGGATDCPVRQRRESTALTASLCP